LPDAGNAPSKRAAQIPPEKHKKIDFNAIDLWKPAGKLQIVLDLAEKR
jgi:hypothetical protein